MISRRPERQAGGARKVYDAIVVGTGITGGWAAKELTTIVSRPGTVEFDAPFACPAFTVRLPGPPGRPSLVSGQKHDGPLALAPTISELKPGSFTVDTKGLVACFDLIKGKQSLTLNSGRPKHR